MTATVLSIVALIVAAVPIYFLAKSNAREAARLRDEATAQKIAAAVAPKDAKIADQRESFRAQIESINALAKRDADTAQRTIDRRDIEIRDLKERISQLEDDLRGQR